MNVTSGFSSDAYFAPIDYCVFIVILSASMAIGIYFGFFSKTLKTAEDYLVGGHRMKTFPVAISLMASQLSAIAIITIPAEVYSFGWQYLVFCIALVFVILVTNYISLPVFYHNNLDNCYAYLEMRFGRATRKILTVLFIGINLFFSPLVMYIPALAFAEVTKFNVQVINIIVSYICVIYTMLGGIKAVVWTDVVQAFVMISSVALVAVLGIIKTGGLVEVWDRAVEGDRIFPPNMSIDLTTRTTFWNTISCMFLMWTCHVSFSQNCAQRLISLPTLNNAKRSMLIFFVGVVLIMSINVATGIIMYSFYHGCDPVKAGFVSKADNLIPRFVQDVAGHIPGMTGIFISCVFSASLSTVSANLHSVAGIIYGDYVRPLKMFAHTDSNANLIMRIIIILLGTICAFGGIIVENFRSIFQVMTTVAGTMTGAKFGVFTLGMLFPWANQKGVLTGIIVGVTTVGIIIINTRMHHLQYTPIPTSIDQCSNATFAMLPHSNVTHVSEEIDDGFAFYKISFQWYPVIGAVMTWTSAIIVSFLTGGPDMTKFNIKLFAPFVQKMLPAKYHITELNDINKQISINKANNNQMGAKHELDGLIEQNSEKLSQ